MKIVADSSSNLYTFSAPGVEFASVPMKIISREKEYEDTPDLDISAMVSDLAKLKTPTGSSCPNTNDWLTAFGDADRVFAITITSALSGSYQAAMNAKLEYESEHPDRKVMVIDSLSAGSEIRLMIEHLAEGISRGMTFEELELDIIEYVHHTHMLFSLQSLTNLANNGRINPAVAKLAQALGICVVGRASVEGTLEPLHKCRGEKGMFKTLLSLLEKHHFSGNKLRIAHCLYEKGAETLAELVRAEYPDCDILIESCTGLCSFYAEKGGLMLAFETDDSSAAQ